MRTINAVIGSPLLAILVFASPASAESHTNSLKGDFAISGGAGCVVSQALVSPTGVIFPPPGFNSNLTPRGPVILTNFSISGIRTFHRDGTGSLTGRTVTVAQGATQAHDLSGQFTYSLADDGTLTIDQGPIDSVAVAGPRVGERSRVTDLPTVVGHLSKDRNTMTFGTFNPGVETVTNLGTGLAESVRICQRSRVAVRIKG